MPLLIPVLPDDEHHGYADGLDQTTSGTYDGSTQNALQMYDAHY